MRYQFINRFIILFTMLSMLLTGCSIGNPSKKQVSKLKIAYTGEIYEVPLFIAVNKNFFKNAGIEVELVKVDMENLKNELDSGAIDGVTADYRFFKYLEEGLDFRLISGIHSGCMEVITTNNSTIKQLNDLRGKTIGVEEIGNGPMTSFSSLIRKNRIDPYKEIKWKTYNRETIEQALLKNEIDAAVIWQSTKDKPNFKVLYSSSGGTSNTSSSNHYQHFFSSFVALSGKLIEKEPKKAMDVTIEWLKAAKWVEKNQKEAVSIAVDNGYVKGSYDSNSYVLGTYMWMPGVRNAKENVKIYIKEQRERGLISSKTDENVFVKKAFSDIIPDFGN